MGLSATFGITHYDYIVMLSLIHEWQHKVKPVYTLTVFTARVHGWRWNWPVNTSRAHGSWTRVVCNGLYSQLICCVVYRVRLHWATLVPVLLDLLLARASWFSANEKAKVIHRFPQNSSIGVVNLTKVAPILTFYVNCVQLSLLTRQFAHNVIESCVLSACLMNENNKIQCYDQSSFKIIIFCAKWFIQITIMLR